MKLVQVPAVTVIFVVFSTGWLSTLAHAEEALNCDGREPVAASLVALVDQAVNRQTRSFELWSIFLTAFVGILFVGVTGWARRSIRGLTKARTKTLDQFEDVKRDLERVSAVVSELHKQLQTCRALAEKVGDIEDSVRDASERVEIANIRAQFLSPDSAERRRAVEKASNKRDPRLIPFLKDVLHHPSDPAIHCEALYGLHRLAEHLAGDGDLVNLVFIASRDPITNVRRKAIDCMAAIGPDTPVFHARLIEMSRTDPDLQDDALRALRHITRPTELPA